MPTIVLDAAQCDLRQSGAPTALLRDCTIVLVWPVTGSYSTARPNYSVKNRTACGRVPRCLHGSLSLSHRVVSEWRPPSCLLAVHSRLMVFLNVVIGRVFSIVVVTGYYFTVSAVGE